MENSIEIIRGEGTLVSEELSILIIDKKGEADNLEQEVKLLGHTPQVVSSYKDAIKEATDNSFDLIFMDMDLPGDWFRTIVRIRELLGEIHIITMTDNNSREIEQQARELKVIYYVVKPLDMREMGAVIDHISKKKTGQM